MVKNNLERFVKAQAGVYETALEEMRRGRKESHWIWYIFPQLKGLGLSETAQYYGIDGMAEAKAYLNHETLRKRLIEISEALLALPTDDALAVMGSPDNLKLCSSMTLFAMADKRGEVFHKVLDKFYGGQMDKRTLELLEGEEY